MNVSSCASLLLVLAVSFAVSTVPAQEQSADSPDRSIYRLDAARDALRTVAVDADEVEPGSAYSYFNEALGRHVWGFATEEGDFQYAFGPGTIVPTDRLDLPISQQVQSELIEQQLPRLERELRSTGRVPAVKLQPNGEWRLLARPSSTRIYDLLTRKRWEWHGPRRVAVLHSHGDQWQYAGGRYLPASGPVLEPCWPQQRFGSAAFVLRTAE